MRIRLRLLLAAVFLLTNGLSPSSAVENGTLVSNDENAVFLLDGTVNAFLYKPQIVFTAAHSNEVWNKGELFVTNSSGRKVKVEKLLVASGFKDRSFTQKDIAEGKAVASRLNDFAIVILAEPLPMTKTVELITPEQLEEAIRNTETVYSMGYSFFDNRRIVDGRARQLQAKLVTKEFANEIYKKYYSIFHPNWGPKGANYDLSDIQITHSATGGSGCDGDSGSGYFINRNETKIYLGPGGSHAVGSPNCGKPGNFGEFGNAFAIEPVYKHLDLIKEAEAIVAKMEKKTTITCSKGKLKKKVTAINPKCPKGYSKVKR